MNPVILLVDDEPEVIEGLKRGLHKLPYTLLAAQGYQESHWLASARISTSNM